MPGHREHRAHAHHRVGRCDQHDVGVGDRGEHAGAGSGLLGADRGDRVGRQGGLVPDPPLLEVQGDQTRFGPRGRLRIVDHDVRLDPVVGHRQQCHTRGPPGAQRRRDLRQRIPRVEHPGADEVGGDVPVAEAEPGCLGVVRAQLGGGRERLVLPSPAAGEIRTAAQGVHARIEVGTHLQSVQPDVVGGVDHRGDPVRVVVGGGPEGVDAQELLAAEQEPGAADPADQDGHLHDVRSCQVRGRARAGRVRPDCGRRGSVSARR